jgi:predicted transcriptional regulator
MEKVNVTLRLDKDKVALLDQFAQSEDRDRTYLIKHAIDGYLQMRQWQLDEIRKAIAEADAGDFASEEEVERMFDQLTK